MDSELSGHCIFSRYHDVTWNHALGIMEVICGSISKVKPCSLRFATHGDSKTSGTVGPTTLAMPLHWAALWLVHATAAPLVTLIVSRHGIRDLEWVPLGVMEVMDVMDLKILPFHFSKMSSQILRSSVLLEFESGSATAVHLDALLMKVLSLPEFMCGSTRAVRVRAFCFFWRNSSCGGASIPLGTCVESAESAWGRFVSWQPKVTFFCWFLDEFLCIESPKIPSFMSRFTFLQYT